MRLFGVSIGPLLTDGRRWAVYEPVEGVTRILDTETGHREERLDPEGCSSLQAFGGGELLYACGDPECPEREHRCSFPEPAASESDRSYHLEYETVRYEVMDLTTGATQIVAGLSHVPVGCGCGVGPAIELGSGLGTEWLETYSSNDKGYTFKAYLNWHTGARVEEGDKPVDSPRKLLDFNNPEPVRELCRPLRRVRTLERGEGLQVYENGDKYRPMLYEPPLAVGPLTAGGKPVLQHCGIAKHAMLTPAECGYEDRIEGEIGAGALSCEASSVTPSGTFVDGVGYVTRLLPHHYPWHGIVYHFVGIPQGPTINGKPGRTLNAVQHTSSMVFATMGEFSSEPKQIYAARLPWARRSRLRSKVKSDS